MAGSRSVNLGYGQRAFRIDRECRLTSVHFVIVVRTQRHQHRKVGAATDLPWDHVMDFAAVKGHITSFDGTGRIHRSKCRPLGWRGEPS